MTGRSVHSRRSVLRTIAAGAAIGGVAGCTSAIDPSDGGPGGDHSVTIEPVGTVEFDGVPETWFPYTGDYADMGVALGQGDGLLAVGLRERFGTHYYEELPDVSVDEDELTELWQGSTDKEVFYELGADAHLVDPNFMINQLGWDEGDVDEIEKNVAPFFGNTIFSRSYPWHDYEYYTLYGAFEKVAGLFDETGRYEAFEALHDEVLEDVQSRQPDETPGVTILAPESPEPEAFYGYTMDGGTQTKQWEDLGVEDALAESGVGGFHETGGTIDYETLLEIDPDAIVVWQEAGVTADTFEADVVEPMREHSVGGNLSAVENDRVVFGGLFYQGPIVNLFQLEMAAQGVYPDEFGDEELFDREAVNDIVTGDFQS